MQMLDEKMKSLNVKLSGRVLRKIVPIYDCNNKEELYSKIGAGIVSLDSLDKALKVNSKSKILKFWTSSSPKRRRRMPTIPRPRAKSPRRRMHRPRRNRNSKSPNAASRFRATRW